MRSLFLSLLLVGPLWADDWPQWFGPQRDGVWREEGIVETFPEGGPKLLWQADIGAGYAGPSVQGNHVYVFDRTLAADTENPENPFDRGKIPGKERLICLDATTGKEQWAFAYDCQYTVSYAAGPRCNPVVDEGLVYILGAEGHLHALTAENGEVVWKKEFLTLFDVDSPGWGFAATPLVDGDQLICLARGEGSTVVSFDKKTGAERWRALTAKEPGYCPPTMLERDGKRILLIWHPEAVNGLDPKNGNVLWSIPWEIRSGLTVATPRLVGTQLFLSCFYNGATLLEFASLDQKPTVVWQTKRASERRTEHLNTIMSTPVIVDGHVYGNCSYGQFRCLRLADGNRVWESLQPVVGKEVRWGNVFVTPHEDRFFLFNELGELGIAKLSPEGYEEISRAKLLEPNGSDMRQRDIVWSHPAYAKQCIFVRNDTHVKCFSLKR